MGLTWRLPLAGLVAFSHLQFSQIRGRQPYLFVRKILYVISISPQPNFLHYNFWSLPLHSRSNPGVTRTITPHSRVFNPEVRSVRRSVGGRLSGLGRYNLEHRPSL